MNAHKFVAEKGIDEAKRVLEGAPALGCYFLPTYQQYFTDKHGFVYVLGMFGYFTPSLGMSIEYLNEHGLMIAELMQVVESLDTINQLFGLDQAKHTMKIAKEIGYTSDYEKIKQAIADYELVESYKQVKVEVSFGIDLQSNQSIGAKCEVLDMVDVSPRCEVINETH